MTKEGHATATIATVGLSLWLIANNNSMHTYLEGDEVADMSKICIVDSDPYYQDFINETMPPLVKIDKRSDIHIGTLNSNQEGRSRKGNIAPWIIDEMAYQPNGLFGKRGSGRWNSNPDCLIAPKVRDVPISSSICLVLIGLFFMRLKKW